MSKTLQKDIPFSLKVQMVQFFDEPRVHKRQQVKDQIVGKADHTPRPLPFLEI